MGRSRDKIWDNFVEEPNPTGKISLAKCKLCDWKHVGIVERMKHHFRTIHDHAEGMTIQGDAERPGPSKIKKAKDSDIVGTSAGYKDAIDTQLAKYFYATNTPFAHADHPEFKKLMQILRPGYSPPSSFVIGNALLDKIHKEVLLESQSYFVGKTVTMSLDGWSNVHNEPIVGISIVDSEGHHILTNSIDTSGNAHTAEYLLGLAEDEIKKCEADYKVAVGSFVTDNTGNVAKMRRDLTEDTGNDIIHYGCTAHILDLLSKDLRIPGVADHVKTIIKYFRNTHLPAAWYKRSGGSKLPLPSKVRWNSNHKSIRSYLNNRGKLIQVCQDHKDEIDPDIFKRCNDVNLATNCTDYCARMHPVAIALDRTQRDQTTIAVAVEIWHKLEVDLKNEPREILRHFSKRKSMAISSHHYLANMIDHRFRGLHLTPEEKEEAYSTLSDINEEFLPILMAHCAGTPPFPQYLYAESLRQTPPVVWWESVELSQNNLNFDWVTLKQGWLNLCKQMLSSIATTAGLERIFSTFGLVHSKVRNKLGIEKASKLTFMYKFLNQAKKNKATNLKWVWEVGTIEEEDSSDMDISDQVESGDDENVDLVTVDSD